MVMLVVTIDITSSSVLPLMAMLSIRSTQFCHFTVCSARVLNNRNYESCALDSVVSGLSGFVYNDVYKRVQNSDECGG